MKKFTFEEFTGYEFNCESKDSNVGFKHVCTVEKDYKTILTTSIQYINRTWESFQFESVLNKAKEKLEKLNKNFPEINHEFLNKLANEGYIADYGVLGGSEDEYVILFDNWNQVDGVKREYKEGVGYVDCELKPSVYNRLMKLASEGLLKDSINYTLLNTEYVFTDEYCRCEDCGKIYNMTYGEIRYIEHGIYEMLCEDCISNNDDVIDVMIEQARDDFSKAVPVCIDDKTILNKGYSELISDLSLSYEQWGEKRFGYNYIDTDKAKLICNEFGGFPKLTSVQQFDCIYSLYVPDETFEDAEKFLINS